MIRISITLAVKLTSQSRFRARTRGFSCFLIKLAFTQLPECLIKTLGKVTGPTCRCSSICFHYPPICVRGDRKEMATVRGSTALSHKQEPCFPQVPYPLTGQPQKS